MAWVRRIEAPFRFHLDPIKGSRFIASVGPATNATGALAFVRLVAAEFDDARHHCFAWRIDADETRSSDDGEPSGSAGRPILAQIDGHDLVRTVVVVTRYFGGVKLGVGGLIRAYGGAAGKALDRAPIVTEARTERLVIPHGYDDTSAVAGVLAQFDLAPTDAQYGTQVTLSLDVPEDGVADLLQALRNRTGGRVGGEG
jgi:uncharacterized YigZ family protein